MRPETRASRPRLEESASPLRVWVLSLLSYLAPSDRPGSYAMLLGKSTPLLPGTGPEGVQAMRHLPDYVQYVG